MYIQCHCICLYSATHVLLLTGLVRSNRLQSKAALLWVSALQYNCYKGIRCYFYRPKSYNPSTHVCCSRTIVRKPARCCGSASYNPNTHTCCGGRVLSTAGISSPACCGNTVYDRNKKVRTNCATVCDLKGDQRLYDYSYNRFSSFDVLGREH